MATAASNILLTLQTKATKGGFADLLSFGTILSKVTNFVLDAGKAAEEYSRQSSKLTLDITAADKATKGLVDTTQLMKNANQAVAAGLPMNSKDFEDFNKVIASTAQAMGKDVTQAVDQAMGALARGRTSTLKEFGIDVKAGTTNAETFARVMEQVREKVDGAKVEVEFLGDRMFILENNLGTATSEMIKFAGTFEPLNVVLDKTNELMETFIDDLKELQTLGGTMEGFIAEMVIGVSSAIGFGDSDFVKDLEAAQKAELLGGFVEKQSEEREKKKKKKPKKPKKPRGKKKPEKTDDEMTFVYDIISGEPIEENELQDKIERQKQLAVAGIDDLILTLDERMNQLEVQDRALSVVTLDQTEKRLDALGLMEDEKFLEQLDKKRTAQEEEFALTVEHKDAVWQLELDQKDREKELAEEHKAWMIAHDEEFAEEQRKIDKAKFDARIMDAAGAFGNLSALQDTENKKAFKVGKAAALASASLAGAISISNALARGLEVPFVGWILGPLYAAAMGVQTAVNLANIAKMQYKGGGKASGISTAPPNTSGATAGANLLGDGSGAGGSDQRPQIINVRLDSDTLLSAVINQSHERDRSGQETIEIKQAS
jgi:hypothetical protein